MSRWRRESTWRRRGPPIHLAGQCRCGLTKLAMRRRLGRCLVRLFNKVRRRQRTRRKLVRDISTQIFLPFWQGCFRRLLLSVSLFSSSLVKEISTARQNQGLSRMYSPSQVSRRVSTCDMWTLRIDSTINCTLTSSVHKCKCFRYSNMVDRDEKTNILKHVYIHLIQKKKLEHLIFVYRESK